MTAWGALIKAGHSWIHVLQIGGVPYIFTETEALRVDASAAPGLPSGYDAWAPALVIKEGMSVGVSMSVGMSVSTSVWEHERPPARTVEPKMSATMPE